MKNLRLLSFLIMLCVSTGGASAIVDFTPHELFRIPFGSSRDELSAKVDGNNFLFPGDFTLDESGHFYIYDSVRHRIARFSAEGTFEMDFRYLSTARQVFAHPDSNQNLWLLITDPAQGFYYGVYDPAGKLLRSGVFSQFNRFRLRVDDDGSLHVLLSSDQTPQIIQTYLFNEARLLMIKDPVARPPEEHHQIRRNDHTYYIDPVPNAAQEDAGHVNRVSDESHHGVSTIKGSVIYVTAHGDVYTRVGPREINVYDVDGSLKGTVHLTGLRSACQSVRFDSDGNIYELDGLPDQTDEQIKARFPKPDPLVDFEDLHYSPAMSGMRLIQWRRD